MFTTYLIIFVSALSALVGLFSLRYVEISTGRTYMPRVRHVMDGWALTLYMLGKRGVYVIEHIPSLLVASVFWLLHIFAILVALSARNAEKWAHKMADSVSHRHNFIPKETRSSFLRQVRHHKETLTIPEELTHKSDL